MAIKVLAWKALPTTFAGKRRHENLKADDVLRAISPSASPISKAPPCSFIPKSHVSPLLGSLVALHAERIGAAATFIGLEDPRTHLFSGEGDITHQTSDGIWILERYQAHDLRNRRSR
ncbi:hypothetical protein E4U13_000816 [Claviceps humidiphila]|uniref:Uncharacterized protein n=1 Tax=Claviceps humidiphila TaxID=1294629 RepID=A0A9P7Q4J6_9HYPO|nr:hypothetical protein E4U13_000816 [Claviceps humidiphila]